MGHHFVGAVGKTRLAFLDHVGPHGCDIDVKTVQLDDFYHLRVINSQHVAHAAQHIIVNHGIAFRLSIRRGVQRCTPCMAAV
ncbi:hypothetical protein D3C78_1644550 [compost metagenome]